MVGTDGNADCKLLQSDRQHAIHYNQALFCELHTSAVQVADHMRCHQINLQATVKTLHDCIWATISP